MTLYRTHAAHEQLAWPLGLRRAARTRRALRTGRPYGHALGWIAAVAVEAMLLVATVTVLFGITIEGQPGLLPDPAPAPTYELVGAPAPDADLPIAAAPARLPAPREAPEPVAAGD